MNFSAVRGQGDRLGVAELWSVFTVASEARPDLVHNSQMSSHANETFVWVI